MSIRFLFLFFGVFSPLFFFFFSFIFFYIYYKFILAEDLCTFASFVDFPFFFWRVSCEGGFAPFLILIFALDANVSKCISESFGRSGYTDSFSRIGKDGVFIRRDCSFHLPRINVAKAGRCVTDTLSKRFMSVWVSTG